ncbi:p-glycoprotein 9 [Heracleum sosnowskyi]|uniref:p-glycoprotein 9 n=1 Tax=Heracleum sosnowskyi TaxID=360622 RepID=A0AAD8HYN3_9APIA|nr:p-glycoprotein 9 [Heracleum sosnowskyi]
MPSGAKKRKAAKKKKVQQSSSLSQGNEYAQHYYDKKSDGGSPLSQDHHSSEHSFAEGDGKEVEKREGSSSGQLGVLEKSSPGGVDSRENVKTEGGIVQIEWELKSEEDYGSKEGSIESKEVHTGGSSGSSSSRSSSNSSRSSSDDESNVEKKTEVVETRQPVDSSSEVASQVVTNIPAGQNTNAVAEAVSVVTPVPIDLGSSKMEDITVSTSEENPALYMDVKDSAAEDKDAKLLLSFNAPSVHTSNGAGHIKESESPECSDSQPLVASAPQVVQKTSFKSCCGIFDFFTSSDR